MVPLPRYYTREHGLLIIVYERVEIAPQTYVGQEDSRWPDKEKGIEHCRLLNQQHKPYNSEQ